MLAIITVGTISFIAGLAYAAYRLKGEARLVDALMAIIRKKGA